jgi:hypothetical protein
MRSTWRSVESRWAMMEVVRLRVSSTVVPHLRFGQDKWIGGMSETAVRHVQNYRGCTGSNLVAQPPKLLFLLPHKRDC